MIQIKVSLADLFIERFDKLPRLEQRALAAKLLAQVGEPGLIRAVSHPPPELEGLTTWAPIGSLAWVYQVAVRAVRGTGPAPRPSVVVTRPLASRPDA